jgi:hypothetical protein
MRETAMRRMTMAATAMLLVGATQPAQERVVIGDGVIEGRIAGLPARTRIDPAAPAMPLIDLALAERAKLKLTGSWGVSIGYRVGNTGVMTRTQVVEVDLGAGSDKRRVGWAQRPFAPGVDVSVGPAALPEPIVRFQLHAPRPGETITTFPALHESGPLGLFGNFSATFARIDVGGAPMRLRFDPFHARTLATAGAAVRLAQAHDGALSGEATPTEIFFGVERPVRDLTLKRPFRLGALSIARLGARTGDFGSTSAIRDGDVAEPAPDPDEILVVAKGKKRDMRRDTLSLGADQLQHCSSIVFDKKAQVIRLTCA